MKNPWHKEEDHLGKERRRYIAEKEKAMAEGSGQQTLGQAMLKAVRSQAAQKQFKFKE